MGGGQISGPANTHLAQVQEVAPQFFFALAVAIGISETTRALIGWEPPQKAIKTNAELGERGAFGALLRNDYYPGDIGFDPLGLKPNNAKSSPRCRPRNCRTVASLCSPPRACACKSRSTTKPSSARFLATETFCHFQVFLKPLAMVTLM